MLIAGAISYKIYMDEVTKQTDLSMEAIETQIYNDVEVVLSSIRQYYLENSSSDEIGWLIQTDSIPYREYSNLFDAQKLLKGPTYIDDYVGKYAFINLEKGWILTNNGMYRLDSVRNKPRWRNSWMRSGIIIQACSGAITSRSRLLTAMGFIRAILWTYQDFSW